jgi:hypothetical protein
MRKDAKAAVEWMFDRRSVMRENRLIRGEGVL